MRDLQSPYLNRPASIGDLGACLMSEVSSVHISQVFKQPAFLQSPEKNRLRKNRSKNKERDECQKEIRNSFRISHHGSTNNMNFKQQQEQFTGDYYQQCISIFENVNINININTPLPPLKRRSKNRQFTRRMSTRKYKNTGHMKEEPNDLNKFLQGLTSQKSQFARQFTQKILSTKIKDTHMEGPEESEFSDFDQDCCKENINNVFTVHQPQTQQDIPEKSLDAKQQQFMDRGLACDIKVHSFNNLFQPPVQPKSSEQTQIINLKPQRNGILDQANNQWKKLKLFFGAVARFRNQEVVKIEDPQEIVHEIEKLKSKKQDKSISFNSSGFLGNPSDRMPLSKVKEIDYFRTIKRFFQLVERGSKRDSTRIVTELRHDPKRFMWNRKDSHHLINVKNEFGQTPLYVACKHGNINIVKTLIEEGCNPHINSKVEKSHEENNLQVSARWQHYDIVKYLLENVKWNRKQLRAAIYTEGISNNVQKLLTRHYGLKYGKLYCCGILCKF